MSKDAYKVALDEAEADLSNALQERDKWTLEVARCEQLVNSLSAMLENSRGFRGRVARGLDEVGIQELIFTCIRQSSKAMNAVDVREMLKAIGYDLGKFSNPLAVIHGALKRLVKADKIDEPTPGQYKRKPMPFFGEM